MSPSGLALSPSRRFSARIIARGGAQQQQNNKGAAGFLHPPRLVVEPSLRSPSPEGRGGQGVRTTPPSASHHHPPAAPCASGTAPPRCERWPTRPSARHCHRTDTARRRPT